MRDSNAVLTQEEAIAVDNYLGKLARRRRVVGACLYGSKIAGYGNPDSDIDLIVVVKNYSHVVRYAYSRTSEAKISALIVDYHALQNDVKRGLLGEFVAGRLLHKYSALINHDLFKSMELLYKKRVILEELTEIVRTTNILCTEIKFPLEFILFSIVKRRSMVYPAALYSYYKMYTCRQAEDNLAFTLKGFKRALEEIMANDKDLLVLSQTSSCIDDFVLQIGRKCLIQDKQGKLNTVSPKFAKKFHILSSYFVHAYAGRKVFHYTMREAESKIKRYRSQPITLPKSMATPMDKYWELEEGQIVTGRDKKWLDQIAKSAGITQYTSAKFRLGDINSRTICYSLQDNLIHNRSVSVVAKKFATLKGLKWAALNFWYISLGWFKKCSYKIDPLERLGTEYKALRYLRNELGLNTPTILAIDFERRLMVTNYVEGQSLSEIIQDSLKKKSTAGKENIFWIRTAGKYIAMIHSTRCALGYIKPNNIIINNMDGINSRIFFTDLEQFNFSTGEGDCDQVWDIIQLLCWSLKRTKNISVAKEIIEEFFAGYFSCDCLSTRYMDTVTMKDYLGQQLSRKSHVYLEQLYPLISTSITQSIHSVIKRYAIPR
jgi:tRNA A-37 threonylcarbamoyl transferase component Bud32/predicted nucleotidyltransferase